MDERFQVSDRDAPHRPSTRNATRVKKGGRNYTFCPILMKNRGRNTTFSSFMLKYKGQNTGWAPFDDPVTSREAELSCCLPGLVCLSTVLASSLNQSISLNPPAQI